VCAESSNEAVEFLCECAEGVVRAEELVEVSDAGVREGCDACPSMWQRMAVSSWLGWACMANLHVGNLYVEVWVAGELAYGELVCRGLGSWGHG
jgi:hypothetical protein